MNSLRQRFNRFCYRNRNKGIPNLMLYIVIGNAIVYLMSIVAGNDFLYNFLCFDRALILKGQVWRLFTYAFTDSASNILLMAIALLCYFSLGRAIENAWGTLRFNLFYFTGILLQDVFAMATGWPASVNYLNLSLLLAYATLYPSATFLLLYIIPVRAWVIALFDIVLTLIPVFILYAAFPLNLFPLVAIANYFLFFGKDVANIIPLSWRINAGRLFRKKPGKKTGTVPFPTAGSYQASVARPAAPYNHRCTVCGRTDESNPELEFRYCSRCNGYHCYCAEHISNHEHIE